MKRVFITGIAGFIGFHLAKSLLKNNVAVCGIDNFNDYYSPNLKKARAEILLSQGAQIIKCDLTNKAQLNHSITTFKPTHLAHLAAQAGVRYSLKNPDSYVQSNLVGFTNLLEVCKEIKDIPIIYASSSSVYGANQKVPFSEEDVCDSPKNLYGATKKANELMAYAYHSLYNMKMVGLRFFTVYGPWGRPDMAYFLFSKAILDNRPIDVFQGQSIERDFTYIDDIVSGITHALDLDASFEIFNLGNHKPVSLMRFIEILENLIGKKAIKNFMPMAVGDMEKTYADITKGQKYLNFSPKVGLEEGLEKFIQWYIPYYKKQQLAPQQSQLIPQSQSQMK